MFPYPDERTISTLQKHNCRWERLHANWLRHAVPPWWARNLIITPGIRETYEKWLPIDEFRSSLSGVARAYLPDESWLPLPLRNGTCLSMPDFWASMPPAFEGRVKFAEEELLPLFCAMADPPRFGTTAGRYPEELEYLCNIVQEGMSILDVGCGVGVNTLEMAAALGGARVTGITPEPLEIWMAQNRRLPHDARREAIMKGFDGNADFQLGSAEHFSGNYDIIVCNGLIGGRFFYKESQYVAFLHCCGKALRPGGKVVISDRFHEGSKRNMERFKAISVAYGFWCDDTNDAFTVLMPSENKGDAR